MRRRAAPKMNKILEKANIMQHMMEMLPEDIVSNYVNGIAFYDALTHPVATLEHPGDKMVHVSNFCIRNGTVYAVYLVNTRSEVEEPSLHTARFVYFPLACPEEKTYLDLQDVGDDYKGQPVREIYETILLEREEQLFLMWTAKLGDDFVRLYRVFDPATRELSEIRENTFRLGDTVCPLTTEHLKTLFADRKPRPISGYIGITPRITTRTEHEERWYYTGMNVGHFHCMIRSRDMITWSYVTTPTHTDLAFWENSVYVQGDRAYYFSRQDWKEDAGVLSVYHFSTDTWDAPLRVNDGQGRSDFFEYQGALYLVHAPKKRSYLSFLRIDPLRLSQSVEVQTCYAKDFIFPYVQEYQGQLYLSCIAHDRKQVYLSRFCLEPVSRETIRDRCRELFLH